jgi:transposase InsO family protein
VRFLCRALGVARSSYAYQSQRDTVSDLALRDAIEHIAVEFPRYGCGRITVELGRRGIVVNHKRVLGMMRAANRLVQVQYGCRATHSTHGFGRFPNLIRGLSIVRPDQVWCADLTVVPFGPRLPGEFVYRAVVLDVFTRAIRGWELSPTSARRCPSPRSIAP